MVLSVTQPGRFMPIKHKLPRTRGSHMKAQPSLKRIYLCADVTHCVWFKIDKEGLHRTKKS